jgi:hypothetical protein
MSATADLASLRALGRPLVSTRDAAVRLSMTESAASHLLRRLSDAGTIRPLRRGLWALEPDVDPMQLVPWLTSPYPSYVSLWTALHAHNMLSQIPREMHAVSLGRPGRIETALGPFLVHRIAPGVFGGYETRNGVRLASPAKAIFDLAYLGATHGDRFGHVPEIELSSGYRGKVARAWAARIATPRIRTMTLARIEAIEREAAAGAGPAVADDFARAAAGGVFERSEW